MSASTVITEGFGTFGTTAFVVTQGYGAAEAPPSAVIEGQTAAGRRRRDHRWVIDYQGKSLVFASLESLFAFLATQGERVEQEAVAKAERDAQRIIATGRIADAKPKPPVVTMASPIPDARAYIAEIERRVNSAYRNAFTSALAAEAEEVEDIKAIAGML